jgi:NAD-dependent SIR2 family protein deacetylase
MNKDLEGQKMDKIADLARKMRAKRESGAHPYVLVLGAGVSVSSGTSLNRAVVERVVGEYNLTAFDGYLDQCSNDERFAILRDLVEGASPSKGYRCLAELIDKRYFNVILSTNFDPLLEDAVAEVPMRRRDYITLVHGVMEPEFVADHLDNAIPHWPRSTDVPQSAGRAHRGARHARQ